MGMARPSSFTTVLIWHNLTARRSSILKFSFPSSIAAACVGGIFAAQYRLTNFCDSCTSSVQERNPVFNIQHQYSPRSDPVTPCGWVQTRTADGFRKFVKLDNLTYPRSDNPCDFLTPTASLSFAIAIHLNRCR